MKYFLGIDGGQSATVALIGDENGRVLSTGRAGPCNHVSGPEKREKFVTAIGGAIAAAATEAGMTGLAFESACCGFSGGAEDKSDLSRQTIDALRIHVTHDAAIAHEGALGGEPGVLAIAGTGSMAYGRDAKDREARAGGWGYIYGDEGSAFDIGREALRAALRQEEGWGPETALTAILLEVNKASTANQLLHRAYTDALPRQQVARWAQVVDLAAQHGDLVATEILKNAGRQLALLAASVRRQLFTDEPTLLSYTGGVFSSALVRETFTTLTALDGTIDVIAPRHTPAAGALLCAYRLAGIRPPLIGMTPGALDQK